MGSSKPVVESYKAGGLIIQSRRLLLVRNEGEDVYIGPGGSIESGETPVETVVRELAEELRLRVAPGDLEAFGAFYSPPRRAHMEVFMVRRWQGEPRPDNEIAEMAWVTTADIGRRKLGYIFEHEVLPRLKDQGLVD
jgi:8-oxo-dGTP diphosphatase